jgi:hypothetical protein
MQPQLPRTRDLITATGLATSLLRHTNPLQQHTHTLFDSSPLVTLRTEFILILALI